MAADRRGTHRTRARASATPRCAAGRTAPTHHRYSQSISDRTDLQPGAHARWPHRTDPRDPEARARMGMRMSETN